MNFKYTIIILSQLLLMASLQAMESPETPQSFWDYFRKRKNFSVCTQIKNLNPDTPESKYHDTVTNLRKNNLTVCDCIKYLLWLKKTKAFEKLEQQVPGATQKILKTKKLLDKYDSKHKKENFSVICDSDVPHEVCTLITQEYEKNKTARDLKVVTADKVTFDASVNYKIKIKNPFIREPESSKKNNGFKLTKKIVLNKESFYPLSPEIQHGIIAHEMTHLNHNTNYSAGAQILLSEEEYVQFFPVVQRSLEAEADRFPAACGCLKIAKCIEADWWNRIKIFDQDGKKISKEEVLQYPNLWKQLKNQKIQNDPEHPSHISRFAWATKIRKLREMEEALKNTPGGTK